MIRILGICLVLFALIAPNIVAQQAASDDAIYDQVRLRLTRDRDVGAANIDVKVKAAVVELNGTVKKDYIKTKAEKLTRKVKGVQQVINNLKVGPEPSSD